MPFGWRSQGVVLESVGAQVRCGPSPGAHRSAPIYSRPSVREALHVGLAVNPGTPIARVIDVLDDIDWRLVMTVHPGFGGQQLISACLDKVRRLARTRWGSVIASWLHDLLAASLARSSERMEIAGRVSDSGEARRALKAAIDESVPAAIRSTAIGERFSWRGEADFANCLLAALRFQFVGHVGHEEQWP